MLKEILHSTSSTWSTGLVVGTVRVDCLNSEVQSRLLADGHITKGTEWMAWNGTYLNGTELQEYSDDLIAVPIRCYYEVPSPWTSPWTEYFSDSINGNLTVEDTNEGSAIDGGSSTVLMELYNNSTTSIQSITAALENFTTLVSNYLTTLDDLLPNETFQEVFQNSWNHPAVGEAFTNQTCIHVRWQWFALPAVILVATFIFFGALITQTKVEHGHSVWKSSQNALIWHGLDGLAEHEAPSLDTVKEMDRRAEEFKV